MKKYITIYFLVFWTAVFSQQEDTIIKESTSYFKLDQNGNFNGEGSEFIKNKIAESQFFLIGEQHDIHCIERLVSSLIPSFKENGYDHYLTEIGPMSAKKLLELAKISTSLRSYYPKYLSQTDMPPFGFFRTVEEEQTLQQLKKYNITLSGIDFENYSSYLFLIDEIYKNSDKKKVSVDLYNKLYRLTGSEYKKGKNNFNPELMNNLLQSNELKTFLSRSKNKTTLPLIEEFERSLIINHQITQGFWQFRVDNMKRNFSQYYNNLSLKQDSVKIFIKLGSVHTARGTSFSGNLEVGNMVFELANMNQSKSFSMISFPRYILNSQTGKTEDFTEDEDKELLKYAFPDQWTVIDLKKLNELSIKHSIPLHKTIISYIQKYDAMVIPPATKYSEKLNQSY